MGKGICIYKNHGLSAIRPIAQAKGISNTGQDKEMVHYLVRQCGQDKHEFEFNFFKHTKTEQLTLIYYSNNLTKDPITVYM